MSEDTYKEPPQNLASPVNLVESMNKLSDNATNTKYKKSWQMGKDSKSYTDIFKKIKMGEVKSQYSSDADRTTVARLLGEVQTLCKNYLIRHANTRSSAEKNRCNLVHSIYNEAFKLHYEIYKQWEGEDEEKKRKEKEEE